MPFGTSLSAEPRIDFLTPEEFKTQAKETPEGVKEKGVRKGVVAKIEKDPEGEERALQFTISTAQVDRDGDTIAVDGWRMENYHANPVVLWAHDYREPPVAQSLRTWIEGAGDEAALKSRAKFASADLYPFGDMIYNMYLQRFLRAVSVGFKPLQWSRNEERGGFMPIDFMVQELLEYSAVPVPSNPGALLEASAKGIDVTPMVDWASKILDDANGAKGLWIPRKDVEALYHAAKGEGTFVSAPPPDTKDDDEEPESTQAGSEWDSPVAVISLFDDGKVRIEGAETLTIEQAKALEDAVDQARGEKRGRVLSSANEGRIRSARDQLDEVLSQLANQDEGDTEEDAAGAAGATEVKEDPDFSRRLSDTLLRLEKMLAEKEGEPTEGSEEADQVSSDDGGEADGEGEEEEELVLSDDDSEASDKATDEDDDAITLTREELAEIVAGAVDQEIRRRTGRLD